MPQTTRILLSLGAAVLLAHLGPITAFAAESQPTQPAPRQTQDVPAFGTAHLSAGSIVPFSDYSGFVAEKNAVLDTSDFSLSADKITITSSPDSVIATGHVRALAHHMHDFVSLGDRAEIKPDAGDLTISGHASAEYATGELMGQGDQVVIRLKHSDATVTGLAHPAFVEEPLHVYYGSESPAPHPRDMQVLVTSDISGTNNPGTDNFTVRIRMVNYVSSMPAQSASIPVAGSTDASPVEFSFWLPANLTAATTTLGQNRGPTLPFPVDEGEAAPPSPDFPLASFRLSDSAAIPISANRDVQLGLSTRFYVYPEGQSRPTDPGIPEIIAVPSEYENRGSSSYFYPQPGPVNASQASGPTASPSWGLLPDTKYVVEAVQTIFATPDPTGAGRKASQDSGGSWGHGNTIEAQPGLSPQLKSGPRQTLWSRTLSTTFTTPSLPNPPTPWPPPLPAVATAPATTIFPPAVAPILHSKFTKIASAVFNLKRLKTGKSTRPISNPTTRTGL